MSAPHPRFPDNTPSLKRVLAAFAPEKLAARKAADAVNGASTSPEHLSKDQHPRDLDEPTSELCFSAEWSQSFSVTDAPGANRLDQIAQLQRELTYGEMIQLAAEIWKAADGKEITAETLADVLWKWSSK